MIDLALVQAELASVTRRAEARYEAETWGTGQFDQQPFALLPTIPTGALDEAKRIARMAASLGPRIVGLKKSLTLGDVNWGGDNPGDIDQRLETQDLNALADELLEVGLYTGIPAGIVRRPQAGESDDGTPIAGDPVIEPLTGHVEPLYDAEQPARVAGIFQAWRPLDARERGWRVRIYDYDLQTMTEWRRLEQPYMVGNNPFRRVENAPLPRYQILRRGRGRMPIGDLELALPLLKSDWSSQVRGDRAEENTAFAQLVVSGYIEPETRGPSQVIRAEPGGDAKYLTPGSLNEIHTHHDRKLERLRRDLNLPGGVLSGSNISGEALREDNMHAIADAKTKAQKMGALLTDLVQDYAMELGVSEPPPVSISINKDFEAATSLDRIILLFREGLLAFDAAVRSISAYVPTWSDEEVEEFIQQQAEVVPTEPTSQDGAGVTL